MAEEVGTGVIKYASKIEGGERGGNRWGKRRKKRRKKRLTVRSCRDQEGPG